MITRERLIQRFIDSSQPAWIIEAGGGFGKTVLLNQLRRSVVEQVVHVRAPSLEGNQLNFLSELADGANRANIRPLASGIVGSEGSTHELAEVIASAGAALFIDDVHLWDDATIMLLCDIVERIGGRIRVVMAGRPLLGSVSRMQAGGGWDLVGPEELRFTNQETARCLVEHNASSAAAEMLCNATDGWPLAIASIAARLSTAADAVATARELSGFESMIDGLIDRYVHDFTEAERASLSTLASLPFFDQKIGSIVGPDDLVTRTASAGVPITHRADGWLEFPSQLRSSFTRWAVPAAIDKRITTYLVERGEIHAAINACIASGAFREAAEIVASLTNDQQTLLEPSTLNAAMTMIGVVADQAPRSLLVQAQVNGTFGRMPDGLVALERAAEASAQHRSSLAEHTVAIECLLELALWRTFEGRLDDAREILETCEAQISPDSPPLLWAKAHDVRGMLYQNEGNAEALEKAVSEFSSSLKIWQSLAEPRPAAAVVFRLAAGVLADLGRRSQALELLDNLPEVGPMTLINQARVGLERSMLLPYLGRAQEVPTVLKEPRQIAEILGHGWLISWSYWAEIVAVSFLGDSDQVMRLFDQHEASGHLLDERTQHVMWCEIAEALARVGAIDQAHHVVARIKGSAMLPTWFEGYVTASVAARSGEPAQALELFTTVLADDTIDHDRLWRIDLLRAYCFWQQGDAPAQDRALASAMQLADELGQPSLLEIVDGPLLVEMTGDEASERPPTAGVIEVSLFDDFALTVDGSPTRVPRGHSTDLLKLLALGGGRLVIDQIVDPLWPDVSLTVGRRRLRNVLARLREGCGNIVLRDRDTIHFAPNVSSDFSRAVEASDKALRADPNLGSLRNALALNWRPLLPQDRYASWAEEARAAHDHRVIALLDSLAGVAEAEGDIELTVSSLRSAHELDPFPNPRLDAAAALLRSEGRDAAAAALEATMR